ncbi:unnamed protein product, partial [Rotaria sordida]
MLCLFSSPVIEIHSMTTSFICILIIITIIVSSSSLSSFAQSTSMAISTDYTQHYENYLITRSTFIHGIIAQTNLSPRFHGQYQRLGILTIPIVIYLRSIATYQPFCNVRVFNTCIASCGIYYAQK